MAPIPLIPPVATTYVVVALVLGVCIGFFCAVAYIRASARR
jgi:uncharacterized protein YneF (UPF0154 family)